MRTVTPRTPAADEVVPGVTATAPVSAPTDIGKMLAFRRCQLGLSQASVAERARLRQPRVSFLERNPERATVAELLSLCSALGLQLAAQSTPA